MMLKKDDTGRASSRHSLIRSLMGFRHRQRHGLQQRVSDGKRDAERGSTHTPRELGVGSPPMMQPAFEHADNSSLSTTLVQESFQSNPTDESSKLWEDAYSALREEKKTLIEHYEALLKNQANVSQEGSFKDQIASLAAIQKTKVENRQWRLQWFGESVSVRSSAERILDITEKSFELIKLAMSFAPPFVSVPLSAITALVPLMMNDIKEHKGAIEGLESVARITYSYQMAEQVFLDRPEHREVYRKCVFDLYKKILEYQALAIQYFGRSTLARFGRNVLMSKEWADMPKTLGGLDESTRKSLEFLALERQDSALVSLTRILKKQGEMIESILSKTAARTERETDVCRWVSLIVVERDHHDVRHKLGDAHLASGRWFLEHETVRSWRSWEDGNRVLWLQGVMGTGKSSLASIFVDHLIRSPDGALAFFYCSHKTDRVNEDITARYNQENILRSILAQCAVSVKANTAVYDAIEKRFQADERKRIFQGQGIQDNYVQLLDDIFSSNDSTRFTLVIDALDECGDYDALLRSLHEAVKGKINVRIFVTSRTQVKVYEYFEDANIVRMGTQSSGDIERYLDIEIPRRRQGSGMTDAQALRLKNAILERANGMFVWAKLQVNLFLNEVKSKRIRLEDDFEPQLTALESSRAVGHELLQTAYDKVYHTAIGTQNEQRRKDMVITALRWVLCAFRTLTARELVYAVCIQRDGKVYFGPYEGIVLELCSNLIVEDASGVIRLAHLSVRHYLEARIPPEYAASEAHLRAALSCLYFRNSPLYGCVGNSDEVMRRFSSYVTEHWARHCREAGQNSQLQQLVKSFFRPSKNPRKARLESLSERQGRAKSPAHGGGAGVLYEYPNEQPKCRGEVDQLPLPIPLHEYNPERRFVFVSDAPDHPDNSSFSASSSRIRSTDTNEERDKRRHRGRRNSSSKHARSSKLERTSSYDVPVRSFRKSAMQANPGTQPQKRQDRVVFRPPQPPSARKPVGFDDDDDLSEAESGAGIITAIPIRPKSRRRSTSTEYSDSHPTGYNPRRSFVDLEDKIESAAQYQNEVNGGHTTPLTAETLRKRKTSAGNRSTRSFGSHDESSYKRSATTRTTRSSSEEDDITIMLPSGAIVEVDPVSTAKASSSMVNQDRSYRRPSVSLGSPVETSRRPRRPTSRSRRRSHRRARSRTYDTGNRRKMVKSLSFIDSSDLRESPRYRHSQGLPVTDLPLEAIRLHELRGLYHGDHRDYGGGSSITPRAGSPDFEWVRKKNRRRGDREPSLLTFLATSNTAPEPDSKVDQDRHLPETEQQSATGQDGVKNHEEISIKLSPEYISRSEEAIRIVQPSPWTDNADSSSACMTNSVSACVRPRPMYKQKPAGKTFPLKGTLELKTKPDSLVGLSRVSASNATISLPPKSQPSLLRIGAQKTERDSVHEGVIWDEEVSMWERDSRNRYESWDAFEASDETDTQDLDLEQITSFGDGDIFESLKGQISIYQIIAEYVACGGDAMVRDAEGNTLLHKAAQFGEPDALKMLLQAGADVNARNSSEGNTPLHIAAGIGRDVGVQLLLRAKADKDARNSRDKTPLHLAVCYRYDNYNEVVETLISVGCDVKAQDQDGNTPLHIAVRLGHVNIVKSLLAQKEPTSEAGTESGKKALSLAVREGHRDIVRLLLDRGRDVASLDAS